MKQGLTVVNFAWPDGPIAMPRLARNGLSGCDDSSAGTFGLEKSLLRWSRPAESSNALNGILHQPA
jgi:hypothetical protein